VTARDHPVFSKQARGDEGVGGWFQATTLLLACLLAIQCIWILGAEFYRPAIKELPATIIAADVAARQRHAALLAASIGGIRGELWALSAFSYANLIFDESAQSAEAAKPQTFADLNASLKRALNFAPAQSGVWLFRAALALRYPSLVFNAMESLKMSYYTGPTEQDLMPMRLRIAMKLDWSSDVEMRQFVTRDIRILLARQQSAAIADAYDASTPGKKALIEQMTKDLDPAVVNWLRAGTKRGSLASWPR
jgi:hypothetical protein